MRERISSILSKYETPTNTKYRRKIPKQLLIVKILTKSANAHALRHTLKLNGKTVSLSLPLSRKVVLLFSQTNLNGTQTK